MFFFVGQGVAVQVEVFAAEEPHAVRAEFVQGFDVFGVFDVGIEFDLGAVFGGGGGVFQFVQFALFACVGAQFAAVFGQYDVVGVDDEYAVDAVDNHPFVFADELAGVAQADDGRDVQAASQDGGVAGGAAGIGYEGGNALFFQVDGIGGREVVGDEYGVVEQVGIKVEFVARSGPIVVDAFAHLQHVLFAGTQVFVVNRVELLAQAVGLDFQRPFGVDVLFFDDVQRFARQGNVGQQHQVQGDERAQFGGGVFGYRAADLFQLAAGGFNRGFEAGGFGGDFVLGQVVLRHFFVSANHQVGAADGDAFACRYAVQHDAHVILLRRNSR